MKSLKNFKDKDRARKYRNRRRKINYENGGFVGEGKRTWYQEWEDKIVLDDSTTDREKAQELKRSTRSIQKRRWRLNNIETLSKF